MEGDNDEFLYSDLNSRVKLTRPNSRESNGSQSRERPNSGQKQLLVEGIEILKKVSSIKSIAGNDQMKQETKGKTAERTDQKTYMGLLSENMILRKESDRKDELISKLTNLMETQGSSSKRVNLGTIRLDAGQAERKDKDPFRHVANGEDLEQPPR
jgi:hypothetical protein